MTGKSSLFPLVAAVVVAEATLLAPISATARIVIGDGTESNATGSSVDATSILIGGTGTASSASIAIGNSASASLNSLASGVNTRAQDRGVTVGNFSGAFHDSVAIGYSAVAGSSTGGVQANGVAIGAFANNLAGEGFAGGHNASAGLFGVAIGSNAASADRGTAIGYGTSAGSNDVVVGYNSAPHSVGRTNLTAFSTSPAAGITAQPGGRFAVGSVGNERQIQNVAPGVISPTSTDAVNGSQLYGLVTGINTVGSSTATLLGGTTTYNPANGSLSGFSVNVGGITYNTVSSAIQAVSLNSYRGWNLQSNHDVPSAVASGDTVSLNSGASGNVVVSRTGNAVSFDLAPNLTARSLRTGGTTVNTAGLTIANGPSVLATGIDAGSMAVKNVAAGTLSATSTDAVNGSQLYATNQTVAGLSSAVDALSSGSGGTVQRGTSPDAVVLTAAGATATSPGTAQRMTNVAAGTLSGTSTDAVNGSQLYATNANVGQLRSAVDDLAHADALSVKYVAGANGTATNTVVLTGDGTNSPVRLTNVAAGTAEGDAVNYGQVRNLVAYDTDSAGARTGSITLSGTNGGAVRIGNLADGVQDSDAVTLRQLKQARSDAAAYTDAQVGELRNETHRAFDALSGSIRNLRQEERAGVAAAMAMANATLPSAPGRLSYAANAATFRGAAALGGSVAYRLDTKVPLALTGGVAGSSGYVGGRIGIMGEL